MPFSAVALNVKVAVAPSSSCFGLVLSCVAAGLIVSCSKFIARPPPPRPLWKWSLALHFCCAPRRSRRGASLAQRLLPMPQKMMDQKRLRSVSSLALPPQHDWSAPPSSVEMFFLDTLRVQIPKLTCSWWVSPAPAACIPREILFGFIFVPNYVIFLICYVMYNNFYSVTHHGFTEIYLLHSRGNNQLGLFTRYFRQVGVLLRYKTTQVFIF